VQLLLQRLLLLCRPPSCFLSDEFLSHAEMHCIQKRLRASNVDDGKERPSKDLAEETCGAGRT
jgi:hypothetical protein